VRISYQDPYFVVKCTFDERAIPKAAGFKFIEKRWRTRNVYHAMKLSSCFDDSATAELTRLIARVEESNSTTPEIFYEAPQDLDYMAHQHVGIRFIIENKQCLLCDDMGVGKTIQVIGAMNEIKPKRTLIVCPASLQHNWARELAKWSTQQKLVTVVGPARRAKVTPFTDITITTYGRSANTWMDMYRDTKWDLLVFDEAQKIKNSDTLASKCFMPLDVPRRVYVTGTPILNRPIELHNIVNRIDYEFWGDRVSYGMRYCGAYYQQQWHYPGATNKAELQFHLRSRHMLRRTKAQVLPSLPPKRREVIELTDTYRNVDRDSQSFYAELREDPFQDEWATFERLSHLRHMSAQAKMPLALKHIHLVLESVDKVVIFAYHRDILDGLSDALQKYNPAQIDGSTTKRHAQVDKFESGENGCRVFIGQITAAGTGLTLASACHVIFVELDWVPGNLTQAEDRCHRIGQINPVTVQHLVRRDSIDSRMLKSIVKKQNNIDNCLDDGAEFDWYSELIGAAQEQPVWMVK